MCFECVRPTIVRKSKRDVRAYKIMKYQKPGVYRSPSREMVYRVEKGKVFHAVGEMFDRSFGGYIKRRLTSFTFRDGSVFEGLHTYRTLGRARNYLNYERRILEFVEFVIPKGTQYLENDTERVSLQLRFVRVVPNKKRKTK